MLSVQGRGVRLCDGVTRRDLLQAGGVGLLGLSLPHLLNQRALRADELVSTSNGKAKACIVLFMMGGPPQHSTWDPKPETPPEIRGEFKPIATAVPGLQVSELMPRTAMLTPDICVIRSMSTGDNAHSSSGYYMLTGKPHQPLNAENANPGAPNDHPNLGAVLRKLKGDHEGLPAAVRLPHHIFNTDRSVWPGQDAGLLGRQNDPWLFACEPGSPVFQIPELNVPGEVVGDRLDGRQSLLSQVNNRLDAIDRSGAPGRFDRYTGLAFDLLRSTRARQAFRLDLEPEKVRDRYGRSQFGQSVLLARRLVEAGVALVQVNWYRGPDEPAEAPCWDSHQKEALRLRTALGPPADQAYSALLEDLKSRGMLDETLVVWSAEFGRTPKINSAAGRDHWGHVFSVALSGGGVRGGQVIGSSDRIGGYPKDAKVQPQDLTATIFHCLGYSPDSEIRDNLNRPYPISRGDVIRQAVG